MEIARYLIVEAKSFLEREDSLPQKLSGTDFYLAKADDRTVMAFGAVSFDGAEYKIDPIITG